MNYRIFGAFARRAPTQPRHIAEPIAPTGAMTLPAALSIPELRQLVAAMVD
ncbi:hypothetical protein P7228_07695 [Altererythrobacter arenosus]|uniref:Uncharacterized protein n=1 Tax=Altererythrobacter arenosus TaxID=3032592 RepID=A0ABY8G007_9SPHN|nr:hypothetical protein [Altererythrobacter sp. CAU 1644]WFL78936.1 hypothetical protein P7228_07695 [Altererythrobacter sp. CAU 1644]